MKKKLIYGLALLVTIIYVVWRIFFTMPLNFGFIDMFFAILLLVAEIMGFIESFGYLFGDLNSVMPEKPEVNISDYPDVDVFIATYNEEVNLLRKTVNGCLNMDYPDKSKVHIFICDDNDRKEMADLAEEMGVGYFRRDTHRGAKAGNLNNALAHTNSPYVVTFDADMIPMHDYLMTVVPYFYMDGVKMGFVQTPQSFYNADLFQYNLFSERAVPNEQNFFFRTIQCGRNKTNSVIYAGSNTMLSREALEKVGGFYEKSITEDMATGLEIQTSGYQSLALSEVHASGLAPTDIKSLFKQRDRWARGCIQTFRQLKILRRKGMTGAQKREYFASLLYWYTPLRRAIFILSPILFSVFNINLLNTDLAGILIFWLPQYLLYTISLSMVSGNQRTPRLSNIYDTIMSFYLIPGVVLESLGIKKDKFEVTKKNAQRNVDSKKERMKFALPQIILLILSILGIGLCIWHTMDSPNPGYFIISCWLVVNIYNLAMAIFFIRGRKYYRSLERFKASIPAKINTGDFNLEIKLKDISEGGMSFEWDEPIFMPAGLLDINITDEEGRYEVNLKGQVNHVIRRGGKWRYAVEFQPVYGSDYLQLAQIVYDRVPSLPDSINHHSSIYEDLKNNLNRKEKKNKQSLRKSPRVEINRNFFTEVGHRYRVVDFDYNYVLLKERKGKFPVTLEIYDKEHKEIKLKLSKEKELKGIYCTYCIDNAKDLQNNSKLPTILHEWEVLNDNKIEELIKAKKKKQRESVYEFHEELYL